MTIYVDINAPRDGAGTKEKPYRTISEAAAAAMPGDEVLVAPGVYREKVTPQHAGLEDARITYRSAEPLKAEITGAEEIKNWKNWKGNVWVCRIRNGIFGAYNPYTTWVAGDWYFGPVNRHTGQVFLNDRMLYETSSLEECEKGEVYQSSWEPEYSVYKWYTEQDEETDETVIYANFQGKDPNRENVEVTVRRECFMPDENGISYITVSGFTIDKAATTWAPPASFQDGMIGPHWSKGWIIEDCEIYGSRCAGISLGRYRDPDNDQYFTWKHVKSPTQMERDAVCRDQYHGWLKENIGHHIVRRCHIHHCEQDGIVGRQGCAFSLIEDNDIHDINNMQELAGAEIAGIKMHAAIDVIVRRNRIHDCTMGIWCDWEAQGTRISQNLFYENEAPDGTGEPPQGAMQSQDIFIEVSHGPTLIDNNLLLSKASLRLASEGIACVHNLILGAITSIGSGTDFVVNGQREPRYTPYHIPHRTETAGFMTILHGDDRFYNNIFVQSFPVADTGMREDMGMMVSDNQVVGTSVLDDYPDYDTWYAPFKKLEGKPAKEFDMMILASSHFAHLPVWAAGNVYLNGAKPWNKEKENLVNDTEHAYVRLTEEDGAVSIKTNIYDIIGDYRTDMITSITLGEAFEPEERFETPEGSDIHFDTDYSGTHRGAAILPGPFSEAAETVKVW